MRDDVRARLEHRRRAWGVVVENIEEATGSVLAFGRRDNQRVVLKIVNEATGEFRAGEVLAAFGGPGVVRVLEWADGVMLMEQLDPATPLSTLCRRDDDEEATRLLASVMRAMSPHAQPPGMPSARDWSVAFDRYIACGHEAIPRDLVAHARRVYLELCESQRNPRLLHGDLHHDNVLFDSGRGWLAVDPKGVVGELEFEVGAALRNPYDMPDLFGNPDVIQSRVGILEHELGLDGSRILAWAYAQAVLAAIWLVEDEGTVVPDHPWIKLAGTIRRPGGGIMRG